jgi:hypothetical protein
VPIVRVSWPAFGGPITSEDFDSSLFGVPTSAGQRHQDLTGAGRSAGQEGVCACRALVKLTLPSTVFTFPSLLEFFFGNFFFGNRTLILKEIMNSIKHFLKKIYSEILEKSFIFNL